MVVATPERDKELVWLERSGHQMFCDCEKEQVIDIIQSYISGRLGPCSHC